MIGDQVATNIVTGRTAGRYTVRVTTGIPFKAVPGIVADCIIDSLPDLLSATRRSEARQRRAKGFRASLRTHTLGLRLVSSLEQALEADGKRAPAT